MSNFLNIQKRKDQVKNEWLELLNHDYNELKYHEYIKDNAGFFFTDFACYLTISKLKLGSEYEVDFVNIKDRWSNGIEYEFIEIEKPSSQLFTSAGVPAKDFNNALQQIRDWKRYLIENKSYFRKFLPFYNTRVLNDSCLKFTIIIGRRNDLAINVEKRNQIAQEANIEIRSFDYLTNLLDKNENNIYPCLDSDYGDEYERSLTSPLFKAITDSDWKKFCQNRVMITHFYKNNLEEIIKLKNKYLQNI
ncbi:DUF4263 domain-containing protein [Dysgonomonas sp. 216]|uniref:Shedu anti-phage system protein SduA domain-containing protein n=1 Tax=Dysgonomonas sp. 216 TaxID=2302934 RepID=UPI0013D2B92C|nr:Shedu anti-phage system protein SduA domain-containing protein [Dysgonomonas sp. 216]NDW18275.1 DUF4263 domain-containing protein [Dysgonomonas sp. 216]NDW18643.1 DUF4263 domain-containing protein [Dysgonomonas sp. 216]